MFKTLTVSLLLSIVLIGCTSNNETVKGLPDDKELELENFRNVLYNEKHSNYVTDIEFSGRKEDWGYSQGFKRTGYFLDITIDSTEKLDTLSNEEKFHLLRSMIDDIKANDDYSYAGKSDIFKLGKITLETQGNSYSMDILDEWDEHKYSLVINDVEIYRTDEQNNKFIQETKKNEEEKRREDIYRFMENKYSEITNQGEEYVPEIHDPIIDKMASEEFGISESEANRIYLEQAIEN
ncbi:hypothetical protein SAMN04487944_101203 [Gracilibacillus ureilyticus]|uniref:Lipoprotein n=1 Tax=Gracilibacillus ureilyticus TaxID=531814 RepID=A0A1H9LCT7_9BACI|nr:hypothetical protein [Gracilibacillus ureilyticus]SER09302.1 hypothetical protein SAMN04487944_101203 [Gracilibacillus ureilyticus]